SAARGRAFAALVAALALGSFAAFTVVMHLVPLLTERGLTPGTAALALGLGGLGQVLGRLGYEPVATRLGVRDRTLLILIAVAATTALLGVTTSAPVLIAASVLAGAARGTVTLLQATAVTDRWGTRHYGQLTGLLSAPVTVAIALAPGAGAALADLSGYPALFLMLAALALGAAALAPASVPRTPVRTE
ncbi:MFS transporter, partial [Saccharomonospora saliphila]|uniref:MFS transporter n=1 Tax=Saccharomonospora saliphila TaxID=369829 RepID=UPI000361F1C9